MLILTRKAGESVVIGEEIYCTVLGYYGGKVRLGFNAPKSMTIHRDEIQRRIWREQEGNAHQDILSPKESVVDRLIQKFLKVAA